MAVAKKWKINPKKIGVLGFSAGGHLASSLSTHHDQGIKKSNSEIEKTGCRPDFSILIYPVVTMKYPNVHMGSKILLRLNPQRHGRIHC